MKLSLSLGALGGLFFVVLALLTSCAPVPMPAVEAATQTPYVVTAEPIVITVAPLVVTATPELQTAVPTLQNTPVCPPKTLAGLTVGYIPGMDIGDKKSPVIATLNCVILTIHFDGAYLQGQLSSDGQSLVSCVFVADREYPCSLFLRNGKMGNVAAYYENKVGKQFPICLAVSSKEYSAECE